MGIHPSLQNAWKVYEEESEESLCEGVTCPVLMLPAGNDPATVKTGGHLLEILQKKPFGADCQSVDCEWARDVEGCGRAIAPLPSAVLMSNVVELTWSC